MLIAISMLSAFSSIALASGMTITSSAFRDGAPIPPRFTCSGANVSPPLQWSGVPSGAKSLALILDDPDAPAGTFVHWVLYDIRPGLKGFEEGHFDGHPGANGLAKPAYMGPCPPPGAPHHYHFRLFALDADLNLDEVPTAAQLRDAMAGHVKESAELVGTFAR